MAVFSEVTEAATAQLVLGCRGAPFGSVVKELDLACWRQRVQPSLGRKHWPGVNSKRLPGADHGSLNELFSQSGPEMVGH